MTWSIRLSLVTTLLLAPVVSLQAAAVPKPLDNAHVRQELSSYFAHIAENSPTVLGGLAKSPDTMAAVQQRIAAMSDQELAGYRKLMAETPDWKVAPELFAKAFPPEVLGQIQRAGTDYAALAPRGQEMRQDVRTLASVLSLLPDEKLKELGIDRATVTSLQAAFTELTPLQAAVLHRQANEAGAWDTTSAAALKSIPPALQRGAAALAQHGALTEKDVAELGSFRSSLTGLLARIDKLPAETRKTLNVDEFRVQMKQLDAASPDTLFMVRHNVPPPMMEALEANVKFLERVANLSSKEQKDLETFRSDLTSTFQSLEKEEGNPGEGPGVGATLSGLSSAHLVVLKDGMSNLGNWQTALPVFYKTLASPELPATLAALKGPSVDPKTVASLEEFRRQTLSEIEAAASSPGTDGALIAAARQQLAGIPLDRLAVMRMSLDSLPKLASRKDRLSVIAVNSYSFSCQISLPSPLPNINLDFICNPIKTALTAIENGVTATINTIVSSVQSALNTTISTLSSALNTAISAVTSTVNSLVSAIANTTATISNFLKTIPDLAWGAIQTAMNLLLDIRIRNGVTVRDLALSGVEHGLNSMTTLIGLSSGWWSAVSGFTLPQIPCPPAGFHTPFGNVGEGAAAANYDRYHVMISNIVGMIPDTEISLKFKIPAQILYLSYDFLGVCLQQAAADADSAEASSRHSLVVTNFTNLQTYIGTQVSGLALASGQQTTQLQSTINAQGAAVRSSISGEALAIQGVVRSTSLATQAVINAEHTKNRNLIQKESDDSQADIKAFRAENLRLAIERVLQGGEGKEIALFELLAPAGYLRLVGDVVNETITSMGAASQTIGQARKFYDEGVTLMNAGSEKEAFKRFGKAYKAATAE